MGDMSDRQAELDLEDDFAARFQSARKMRDALAHGCPDDSYPEDVPRWFNSLGEEVDLDDIDKEYALNIYTHRLERGADARDALSEKLRQVILNGRDPNYRDRQRAKRYNNLNAFKGLPWRAVFKDLHG